jgi:hypothetical protein
MKSVGELNPESSISCCTRVYRGRGILIVTLSCFRNGLLGDYDWSIIREPGPEIKPASRRAFRSRVDP